MPALRLARRRDRVEIALSGTRSTLGRARRSRGTNSASTAPAGPRRVALFHRAARTLHRSPGQRSRQPRQRLGRHRESQHGSERTRTSSWRRGRWQRRSGRSKTFRLPLSRRLRIFGAHASLYVCVPDANRTGRLHSVHVSCRNRPTAAQPAVAPAAAADISRVCAATVFAHIARTSACGAIAAIGTQLVADQWQRYSHPFRNPARRSPATTYRHERISRHRSSER